MLATSQEEAQVGDPNGRLAGKDGPITEKAKSALAKLQSFARLSNVNNDDTFPKKRSCHHCEKVETPMDKALLMRCQRCKTIYYCNKECQINDWKSHAS
jgi:hypothetical protein